MILVPRRWAVFIRSFFIYNLQQLEAASRRERGSPEPRWADVGVGSCCLQPAAGWHRGGSREPRGLQPGLPRPSTGAKPRGAWGRRGNLFGPVWSGQEQLRSRTPAPPSPGSARKGRLRRRDGAWAGACSPKGAPLRPRPAPPHPSIRVKPPFGGLRLGVRLAGSGRRRRACLCTQVTQRGAKQDGAPRPSPGSISHPSNEGLPRASGS